MGRPINADAAATRARILQSALALFAQRGVAGSSVRAVAEGAQVSVAMVHHYFGSKDGLQQAVLAAMYAELGALQAHLQDALSAGGSTPELIERAVREGFRFACAHRTATRLLYRQIVTTGTLDADRRLRHQGPFLAQVSAALGAALGRPARDLRLPLQTVVMLTSRYAISDQGELAFFVDAPTADPLTVVEDHLVEVALSLLTGAHHVP